METTPITERSGERTTLEGLGGRLCAVAGAIGLAALAVAAVIGWTAGDGLRHFFHAYLTSYAFFLSISLGALCFVAIQHVTRAGWSVAVRRLAELLAGNLPLLAFLFLPILLPMLLGNHSLYPWTDPKVVAQSELIQHKEPYLNLPFFTARCVLYFTAWMGLAGFFLRRSLRQDESGEIGLTRTMERLSGPALILFGVTVTFAAFDLLMSLSPEWFSTMFGIYYFAGAILAGVAAVIVAAVAVQATGRLTASITAEHYHDLGKHLFGFTFFWGYVAFSQYMLIWYANIPEETVWYLTRQTGPWAAVSLVLLVGHLLIPFVGLLPRWAKRCKAVLSFWAVWLLAFHWLDMYYLVMPNVSVERLPLGAVDLLVLVGLGGLYLAGLAGVAGHHSLVPARDPRLGESLAFENP